MELHNEIKHLLKKVNNLLLYGRPNVRIFYFICIYIKIENTLAWGGSVTTNNI